MTTTNANTSDEQGEVGTKRMEDNKLQIIFAEQGIDKPNIERLVEAFGGPFDEVGQVLATYREVVVADENDAEGMATARQMRLQLKKARTTVENKRKELKADIVKQGRAIDSVARFVKENIEPAEAYLERQEKYAEIKQAERAAALRAERIAKLSAYTSDFSLYNLDDMNSEQFASLLDTLKVQHEAKLAEEKRLEDERLAKEKAEAEEAERIRAENERLKTEAAERDAAIAAEREAREELEREKREREAAETRKREEAEEAERQAQFAPDRTKLLNFAAALEAIRNEKLPAVTSNQARAIVGEIDAALEALQERITKRAKGL